MKLVKVIATEFFSPTREISDQYNSSTHLLMASIDQEIKLGYLEKWTECISFLVTSEDSFLKPLEARLQLEIVISGTDLRVTDRQ